MILVVHRRVVRQVALKIFLDLMIIGVEGDPAVTGENRATCRHRPRSWAARRHRAGSNRPSPARRPGRPATPAATRPGAVRNMASIEPS